jgi:CO dehydrogenase/acetyl-CoA synthase gamma subunit (corrinoid Fe-S protein)
MVTQCAEPGDMVRVQMGVDGLYELEIQFVNKMQIAVDLFQDRIDDQRLAARTAREKIGIGTGYLVEELTEDHFKS